jgi:PAS domain S-box-containing protein
MSLSLNTGFAATYLDTIFKHTKQNTVLLLDENGIITEINTAFTNYFGYTRSQMVGSHLEVLFTEEDRRLGLPQLEIDKVLSDGQASDNNFLVDHDQNLVWVAGESILVSDDHGKRVILKIIQNINTQKISENSMIRLHRLNENILASIEDIVIVVNKDLEILKANKSFYKLFTQPRESDKKLSLGDLIKPFDANGALYKNIQRVIKTKCRFTDHGLEIDAGSGEKRAFDISCCIIENAGSDANVLLTAHDVTVQKQTEKEREDIIGFVAHELRNPLANVVLCNEMMTQLILDNDTAELEEYLTRSKNNVMRLNKMIGELYDATKFHSGNFNLEKTAFDFERMIEEALDTLEVLHPDYDIIVEGECSRQVYGDRYRLIQVVTNFLSNGIKYSNKNTKVLITLNQDEENVTVSVKDDGLGISAKQLPHIFGRFFRAERTKNLEGIGLGLYLCRRIVEAHSGRVWAESEEGKGSTFFFSIPFKVPEVTA